MKLFGNGGLEWLNGAAAAVDAGASGGGAAAAVPPNVVHNLVFLMTSFLQMLAYISCLTWWTDAHLNT